LRCIQLAKNGLGFTAPNPMVGSVIVHDQKIIGEGYTCPYGGSHAEVNAIASVKDKSLLSKSALYVTLEPCSHFGKTPPCADLIIKYGISQVFIGIPDPHKKVAGNGIQKLKEAGCHVTLGVLESDCWEHHRRFMTFHEKGRPYIILKWAETLDRFLAPDSSKRKEKPEPYWITNSRSKQLVHQWRSEEQAILVGTNTILEDNPKLNTRHWKGKSPVRIVLDKDLKIDGDYQVLDGSNKTIIITQIKDPRRYKDGIDYEIIDFSGNLSQQLCDVLYKHQLLSMIVEGGAQTLLTFINANLWDEARIFTGSSSFGSGIRPPDVSGRLVSSKNIGNNSLKVIRND